MTMITARLVCATALGLVLLGCGQDAISGYRLIVSNSIGEDVWLEMGGNVIYTPEGNPVDSISHSVAVPADAVGRPAPFVSADPAAGDGTSLVRVVTGDCVEVGAVRVAAGVYELRINGPGVSAVPLSGDEPLTRELVIEERRCPG